MKKPNRSFYISIVAIGLFISFLILKANKIKKHGVLLNVHTTKWVTGAKLGMSLKYEFYYKGKHLTDSDVFDEFNGNQNFANRDFPVMYYEGLGGDSELLVEPEDFAKFNLSFPDSLDWVLPYLKE